LEPVDPAQPDQILKYPVASLLVSLLLVEVPALPLPSDYGQADQVEALRFIVVQLLAPELWDRVLMEEPLVDILRYLTDPEAEVVAPAPADMLDPATV